MDCPRAGRVAVCCLGREHREADDTGATKKPPPTDDTTRNGRRFFVIWRASRPTGSAPSSPSAAPRPAGGFHPSPFGLPPRHPKAALKAHPAPRPPPAQAPPGPAPVRGKPASRCIWREWADAGHHPVAPNPLVLPEPPPLLAEAARAPCVPRRKPSLTFVRPNAYGQSSQIFNSVGIGRPRFRYTASVQIGFDDNVLQTPTNSPWRPRGDPACRGRAGGASWIKQSYCRCRPTRGCRIFHPSPYDPSISDDHHRPRQNLRFSQG